MDKVDVEAKLADPPPYEERKSESPPPYNEYYKFPKISERSTGEDVLLSNCSIQVDCHEISESLEVEQRRKKVCRGFLIAMFSTAAFVTLLMACAMLLSSLWSSPSWNGYVTRSVRGDFVGNSLHGMGTAPRPGTTIRWLQLL